MKWCQMAMFLQMRTTKEQLTFIKVLDIDNSGNKKMLIGTGELIDVKNGSGLILIIKQKWLTSNSLMRRGKSNWGLKLILK